MSVRRAARSGAFLEMAGLTILWAFLLFAVALITLLVVGTIFAKQIGVILGIFGIAAT